MPILEYPLYLYSIGSVASRIFLALWDKYVLLIFGPTDRQDNYITNTQGSEVGKVFARATLLSINNKSRENTENKINRSKDKCSESINNSLISQNKRKDS